MMRLAFKSSVLPKPLVPMTMNLSSRSRVRKSSISGVRWSSDSSKSSATRRSRGAHSGEVLRSADVVGVHGPGAHVASGSTAKGALRIAPFRGDFHITARTHEDLSPAHRLVRQEDPG